MARTLSDGVAVHGAIVDAIAAGDANLATDAMLCHFERSSRCVERAM
jgi:DNA-binding GntR family transcriptional regulator